MNLHLAYRQLAITLSEAGFPTLRLDYPGTCDSSGSSRDADRFSSFLSALNHGADYLLDVSGNSRLALFGARFGANLAVELAASRDDVSQLALWGVYRSGRQFLRTESAFDRLIAANPTGRKPRHWQDGDQEAAGFLYRRDLVEAIQGASIDSAPIAAEVLLFDWDDEKDSDKARESLTSVASKVSTAGLLDRGSLSLQKQLVPDRLNQRVVSWLAECSLESDTTESNSAAKSSLTSEISLHTASGLDISERAVRFGENSNLFGVLTTPSTTEQSHPRTGILLVNGGNNHRPGINRNYTEWARRWAGAGYSVLRMDIRGLGDSPPLHHADLNRLYMERTVEDVADAAAWLRGAMEIEHLTLCGYCAGAYQALNFARRGAEVDVLLLIELLRYYPWEPLQNSESPWKARLLRYWARFHPMWLLQRGRIGRWLNDLSRRGVDTLVVYREDERMLSRFKSETTRVADALASSRCFELRTLSPSNHIISPLFAQEELSDLLMEYLKASIGRNATAG